MSAKNRVLLTGGSRGIGKAIANLLHSKGYTVVSPTHNELDLSNRDSVTRYKTKIKELNISILINNAGINPVMSISEFAEEPVDETLQVNLVSPIFLIQSVWEGLKKQNYGRIVNISSIWSTISKPGRAIYTASKAGVNGLTRTLAVEGAPYNILVNSVCPGYIDTELTRKNNSYEDILAIEGKIPIGRMGTPEEIAKIVLFLVSEDNTYITGQSIIADGGFSIM